MVHIYRSSLQKICITFTYKLKPIWVNISRTYSKIMDEHFHISLSHTQLCVCWCGQSSHLFIMLWQCLVSCVWPAWGQWEWRRGEQVWGRQAGGCADGLSQRMLLPANAGSKHTHTQTHTHTHGAYRSPNPHLRPPYTMFAFNQGTLTTCTVHSSPVRILCWQEQWAKTLMRWWPTHSGECHSYSSYCWSLASIFWITQI